MFFSHFRLRSFLKLLAVVILLSGVTHAKQAYSAGQGAGPVSVADLAERLTGSVVNISTVQVVKKGENKLPDVKLPPGSPLQEFFKEFLEREKNSPTPRKSRSLGSGFVIDTSGLIVTNNHVIAKADEIIVNFADGTKEKAEIVGRDPKTDIALLKINTKKTLKAVALGDSSKMRVGDWVMAIGNPFGLGGSVSMGIVSARNRDINAGPYDDFIQTDAAINKGNSGGPLFNMKGEVIGINTAIISPTGGSIGIGFSVPSSTAKPVIAQLKDFGETRRGWLGVRIQTVSEDIAESLGMSSAKGALVADVTEDGPAEKAKILPGDIIIQFNGKDVPQMRDLPRMVAATEIGERVKVVVLRAGKEKTVKVKIGRLEDGEKKIAAQSKKKKKVERTSTQKSLGLSVTELNDALRKKLNILPKVKGVLIKDIDPKGVASGQGLRVGDIIVQVSQKPVNSPAEFVARVNDMKKADKKAVLLLVSNSTGDHRFVPVRFKED